MSCINKIMKQKLLYDVALLDIPNESASKIYDSWCNLIGRCYSKSQLSRRPTYTGCKVCDEWLIYSNYKNWYLDNYIDGYHLDKDILSGNSKIYSPETCVFIPVNLNVLLTDRRNGRGKYPLGVNYEPKWNRYKACISIGGKVKHLGYFKTPELAHECWVAAKKKYVSECANEAYAKGEISERVRDALLNRKFE